MTGLLGTLVLAWALGVTVVSAVAIARVELRRRAPAPASPPGPRPRVVVVRPCAGLEPHLRRSLGSTATLHDPAHDRAALRVVLTTSTADDPARPVLLEVAASLRARGMDATVAVIPPHGPNLKASQLAGVLDSADDDVALVVDSDVELERLDLDRLLAPLGDPHARVAAVWCPPVEREPKGLGDRMSAALLGGSLHAFALLGALDPQGLVGKTFAVRLDALRSVDGFSWLVRHLGEDVELARRLRAAGWRIVTSPTVVASLASGRRMSQVLARYARWLMVIRAQRPLLLASYPLLLAATPGLLVAGGLALAHGLPGARAALGLALASRVAVGLAARRTAGRSLRIDRVLLDAVLADALMLAAFVRAAVGPARVRWRQRSLRLGAHGQLIG